MTVTLSTDVILENIYATSALYAMTNNADKCPGLLHRDHREALVRVINDAFSFQILEMLPYVTAYTITDSTMTMDLPDEIGSEDVSPAQLLLSVITARTLAAVWLNIDYDRSLTYQARTTAGTQMLIATLTHPQHPLRISRCL